jgi:hypothetical protein
MTTRKAPVRAEPHPHPTFPGYLVRDLWMARRKETEEKDQNERTRRLGAHALPLTLTLALTLSSHLTFSAVKIIQTDWLLDSSGV